ncbi:DUF2267 domain-containing protein [Amycolatopsis benzoatilytica]|uniref:DUF2267 domain-containing protein n=1 Tax=Amycolatopsis benzoatilytica TaxID=346045 RepID=UPI000374C8B0|nr:DUF2267 domain-containing protein [Amycolatopsis benzoatilytica]
MTHGDVHTYRESGLWANRVEGGRRVVNTAVCRGDAVAVGREMAAAHRVDHFVHSEHRSRGDGEVVEHRTFRWVPGGDRGYPDAMSEDETVELMRRRMFLSERDDAERIVRAVLRTLAELIPPGTAGRLAAQLPAELADDVRPVATPASGADRELAGFVGRVAERAGLSEPEAIHQAGVVLEVLGEVTVHVADQLQEAVPEQLRPLLAAGGSRLAG